MIRTNSDGTTSGEACDVEAAIPRATISSRKRVFVLQSSTLYVNGDTLLHSRIGDWLEKRRLITPLIVMLGALFFVLILLNLSGFRKYFGLSLNGYYATRFVVGLLYVYFLLHCMNRDIFRRVIFSFDGAVVLSSYMGCFAALAYAQIAPLCGIAGCNIGLFDVGAVVFRLVHWLMSGICISTLDALLIRRRWKLFGTSCLLIAHLTTIVLVRGSSPWSALLFGQETETCIWLWCATPSQVFAACQTQCAIFTCKAWWAYARGLPFACLRAHYQSPGRDTLDTVVKRKLAGALGLSKKKTPSPHRQEVGVQATVCSRSPWRLPTILTSRKQDDSLADSKACRNARRTQSWHALRWPSWKTEEHSAANLAKVALQDCVQLAGETQGDVPTESTVSRGKSCYAMQWSSWALGRHPTSQSLHVQITDRKQGDDVTERNVCKPKSLRTWRRSTWHPQPAEKLVDYALQPRQAIGRGLDDDPAAATVRRSRSCNLLTSRNVSSQARVQVTDKNDDTFSESSSCRRCQILRSISTPLGTSAQQSASTASAARVQELEQQLATILGRSDNGEEAIMGVVTL